MILRGARVPNLAFWGDSLTAGTGASSQATAYPYVVANSGPRGRWFWQGGVGGQTSTQIGVRQGGVATTATVVGGQIPASGGVTVTFPTGFEPVTSQGPSIGTLGTISGVLGTIGLSGSTYTFTRSVAGSTVNVSSALFVPSVSFDTGATQSIWAGRNNYIDPTQVQSDIASMTAIATHFVVLSILNGEWANEHSGQSGYNQILALNAALATTYGSRFIDVRTALLNAYNPANTMDVADVAAGVPPYSLRAVNISGALTQSIGTGDTSFTTSATFGSGYVLLIDSEYIYVNTVSGTTVTSCMRGYGGSSAASHSNSAAIAGTDPLHLNDAGYAVVASSVYANLAASGW